jgi:hypothetical protein
MPRTDPAREALTRAVNKALADGAPEYVNVPDPHGCRQCGTWLNPVARMLGPVCGTCTRKNHEAATR